MPKRSRPAGSEHNLTWSAWLYARFLRGRGSFAALEQWQVTYLPLDSM